MHVVFTEEEKLWIEKKKFNWAIKKGCPTKVRKRLEKKLNKLLSKTP